MNDFSSTQAPEGDVAVCADCCDALMDEIMEDVNKVARIPDPVDRNVAITQRYKDLGAAAPNNHWVRLAGYVSTQGGCAMKNFYPSYNPVMGTAAQTVGRAFVNPGEALESLKDANTAIFTSVYPPNKFVQEHGFDQLQACVEAGELDVPPELMQALEKMDDGDLAGAAYDMAAHEQLTVVQDVYKEHADTFDDMMTADSWVPGDQTSIPVSYECTRDNLVSLGDLDIRNPQDRVDYYGRLMKEMKQIEGLQ